MRHLIREALRGDDGMTTAEYAIGTIAAAALATALYVVLSSDAISQLLQDLVTKAFSVGA
jgi:Flp pilus assembly pilin Flp